MGRRSWCFPCPGPRDPLANGCFSLLHYGVPRCHKNIGNNIAHTPPNCMFRTRIGHIDMSNLAVIRVALSPRFHIPEARPEGRGQREKERRGGCDPEHFIFLSYARGVKWMTVSLGSGYLMLSGVYTGRLSIHTIPYLHRTMDAGSGSPLGHGQCRQCRSAETVNKQRI